MTWINVGRPSSHKALRLHISRRFNNTRYDDVTISIIIQIIIWILRFISVPKIIVFWNHEISKFTFSHFFLIYLFVDSILIFYKREERISSFNSDKKTWFLTCWVKLREVRWFYKKISFLFPERALFEIYYSIVHVNLIRFFILFFTIIHYSVIHVNNHNNMCNTYAFTIYNLIFFYSIKRKELILLVVNICILSLFWSL